MFSNWFLKSFRILLLPFAIIYWFVIWLRNLLYDKDILKSSSFGLPVICVGNLSVGGTGKSPMVEFLVQHLKDEFRIATLSRGYKRKTRGYALANETTTALDVGDEPMQFHLKFPDIAVAVGEERLVAIPQLLHDRPETQVIILDDAFQHRAIRAGMNILLTDYNNLFTRDFYMPTGDLRDLKSGYKRAQIIIVTKCPEDLSNEEAASIRDEINMLPHQLLFFTAIRYRNPRHIITGHERQINDKAEVLLVTGVANPQPLKNLLEENAASYYLMQFRDHHIFSIDDMKDIKRKFERLEANEKMILTTEKDAVRLMKFKADLEQLPLYVIPVRHHFLFEEEQRFNDMVKNFIVEFRNPNNNSAGTANVELGDARPNGSIRAGSGR